MKTNFIHALRNIKNNATNSLITVIGLSVAIACCLLIYFFVSQENSYNQFHSNIDRLYRLNYERKFADGEQWSNAHLNPELIELIKTNVPEIEKCTEYRHSWGHVLEFNDVFYDVEMSYAREEFFHMFDFPFIAGNKSNIFENPDEIVLTRKTADKLITDKNESYSSLLGKSIRFPLAYGDKNFQIAGVLENIPRNSGIQFEGIIPGENGRNFGGCNNDYGYTLIYYLLKENANPKLAEASINRIILDYYAQNIANDKSNNILSNSQDAFVPYSLSLHDVYFENEIGNCYESTGDQRSLNILIAIAILILIIACSNYGILSLGQYMKKIGDIGILKYMGAKKHHIFSLFLTEGIILSFASFLLGAALCVMLIPIFGRLAQREIFTELIDLQQVTGFTILFFITIVLLTSIIPVFFFANVNPSQMKTKALKAGGKNSLSKFFVSFQYCTSIVLIIVTIFIVRQSEYLKNKSLGLNTENIIDVSMVRIESEQRPAFRDRIKKHVGVQHLTMASRNFMNGYSNGNTPNSLGDQITTYVFKVDPAYITTLGLKLIQGNNFTESNMRNNDRAMIVNEKFIEEMLIEDDPIGNTYRIWGNSFSVIGVVNNFHFSDMREPIRPAMLYTRQNMGNSYDRLLVKYHPQQLQNVIKHIQQTYTEMAPGKTLDYTFWNEELANRYENEERWSKIIGYAASIAIIISCLGLFGLTILLINQRIKEIGVRKVNGATAGEVLATILKSFIIWLIGALIIAAPLAYLIVNKWLENFPYRVLISWWVFAFAGIIALSIALLTVSWHSWRAASRNPVEALRYE